MHMRPVFLFALLLATACGNGDGGGASPGKDGGGDAAGGAPGDAAIDTGSDAGADASDAGSDAAPGCGRVAGPADAVRKVVVSHPYDASSNPSNVFEVLELSPTGELSQTGTTFALGRQTIGEIAFTPDGKVGFVAEDDGKLGVFRFNDVGAPEVVDAAFDGGFYAGSVVVDPGGDVAYVLDSEWRASGGGVYAVPIGCDGTPGTPKLVAVAKLPYALAFLPGDPWHALLVSKDVLSVPEGNDVHLLSWGDPPSVTASSEPFPDNEAIVPSAVVTHDGKFALVGDNNAYGSAPNRVGVVSLSPFASVQLLTPIEDPLDIAVSPFDNAALVVSGFGNAIFRLAYDPSSQTAPFTLDGEIAYQGAKPQLPGYAVSIDRGALSGLVLVAENTGVRRVRFESDGSVTDLGAFNLGTGLETVTGVIGVQP